MNMKSLGDSIVVTFEVSLGLKDTPLWQRNLKKLCTLKKISFVKFGTKSMHFEKKTNYGIDFLFCWQYGDL